MKTKKTKSKKLPTVKCVSCHTATTHGIFVNLGNRIAGPYCNFCGSGNMKVYDEQSRGSTLSKDCADSRIECDLADCASCKGYVGCTIR